MALAPRAALPPLHTPHSPPLPPTTCVRYAQPEEGRYALEDLSARLPVDLSSAERTHGLFTQNCIVVAEGELREDGVFKVCVR